MQPVYDEISSKLEWPELRKESLNIGGFKNRRGALWPRLLQIHRRIPSSPKADPEPHRDERQIKLDTQRSFVLYPVDDKATDEKEGLQAELHELIVSVFRKRPRLSYFQGYHDIVTVLFLTLPSEIQLACAEKLSLHRVRDSMGTGLEPILGLLRVMKNLIRLADPPLAVLLERISPLPYYALSNLLTLFSHDMPSLPLIQHAFDYLLCRPPIAVVYLATALILCRKAEIETLEAEGEEGMVHSLLSGLPDLYEEGEEEDCYPEPEADGRPSPPEHMAGGDPDDGTGNTTEEDTVIASSEPVESTPSETTLVSDAEDTNSPPPDSKLEPLQPTVPSLDQPPPYEPAVEPECTVEDDDASPPEPPEASSSDDEQPHHRRPRIALTTLLVAADELFTKFPPTHPELSLSSIMGPQSVVFTWSESKSEMPSDDEAERMVEKPELIVRPYVDPDATKAEADSEKRRGHRRGKKSRAMFGHVERRTVVAGAVVMVGVAVAVYGIKTKGGIGKDGTLTDAREWQKAGNWIGGALISVGERLYHGMS